MPNLLTKIVLIIKVKNPFSSRVSAVICFYICIQKLRFEIKEIYISIQMNTDTDSTPKKRKIELPKGGTTPRSFANYFSPGIGMEVESNEVKYKDRVVSVGII